MYTGCHIVTKLHHYIITWFDKYIILMINIWTCQLEFKGIFGFLCSNLYMLRPVAHHCHWVSSTWRWIVSAIHCGNWNL